MDLSNIRKIAGLVEQEGEKKTKKIALTEDLQSLFKIAGMTSIMESYDDSDDDYDEDEDAKKADEEAKKRNIKLPEVKAKPKVEIKDDSEDDESEDDKPKPKKHVATNWGAVAKQAPITKEKEAIEKEKTEKKEKVAKKERAPGEVGVKGKPKNPNSNRQRLIAWIEAHPECTKKDAMKFNETFEKPYTPHGLNTIYGEHRLRIHGRRRGNKAEISEYYVIAHPHMSSFILHENRELSRDQWISENEVSDFNEYIFETEEEAEEFATKLREYQSQSGVVKRVMVAL